MIDRLGILCLLCQRLHIHKLEIHYSFNTINTISIIFFKDLRGYLKLICNAKINLQPEKFQNFLDVQMIDWLSYACYVNDCI